MVANRVRPLIIGAINAMQDAVILVNCLYDMGEPSVANIKAAFQQYYDLRFERAKTQFANSKFMAKLMSGQVKKRVYLGSKQHFTVSEGLLLTRRFYYPFNFV